MLDTLYPLNMTPLPGYWDADRDRPRTRHTRPSNSQYTTILVVIRPLHPANFHLATRACHIGSKPEVYNASLWPYNASGAAMRID